jgi:hypothetical protein
VNQMIKQHTEWLDPEKLTLDEGAFSAIAR